MQKLDVLFVTPKHGFLMTMVGGLVRAVTASRFSHVAGVLWGKWFEAAAPELSLYDLQKYAPEHCKEREIVTLYVTDADMDAIERRAKFYLATDTKYGVKECCAGGVAMLLGRKAGRVVKKVLKCNTTADCSEVWTVLLHQSAVISKHLNATGLFLKDADLVTPQELYASLVILAAEQAEQVA